MKTEMEVMRELIIDLTRVAYHMSTNGSDISEACGEVGPNWATLQAIGACTAACMEDGILPRK